MILAMRRFFSVRPSAVPYEPVPQAEEGKIHTPPAKQWGKLLITIVLAIIIGGLAISRIILYFQTDSFFYQPYSYYAWRSSAQRLHAGLPPGDFSQQCSYETRKKFPRKEEVEENIQKLLEDRFPEKSSPSAPLLTVGLFIDDRYPDAFPWFWDFLFYTNRKATENCETLEITKEKGSKTWKDLFYTVEPEYHYEDGNSAWSAGGPVGNSCKFFSHSGIKLEKLENPLTPEKLVGMDHILFIGDYSEEFQGMISSISAMAASIGSSVDFGLLLWGFDTCHSPRKNIQQINKDTKFAFLTYGDCQLVDNENVFQWPLGPAVLHGFPSLVNAAWNPPADQRPVLLNLMATYNPDKPSRMQAWMVAEQQCRESSLPCLLQHSNFLKQIFHFAGSRWNNFLVQIGWGEKISTIEPNEEYLENLRASQFTLCPVGKNPESYRLWESIAAGSIPIVEEFRFHQGLDLHPAYGNTFACGSQEIHGAYKQFDAPILYVEDWADLPALLEKFKKNPKLLNERQRKLKEWLNEARGRMHQLVTWQILKHFLKPSEKNNE